MRPKPTCTLEGRKCSGSTDLPEGAGEDVHRDAEQGGELDDPNPRRSHVQQYRQQAARLPLESRTKHKLANWTRHLH
jgi:hypothetical protein